MTARGKPIGELIVPLVTPRFGASVDFPSLKRLIEFVLHGGADVLFVLGTTGEFQYLSPEEAERVIHTAARGIRGRVPVWVGISAPSLEESLALAHRARESEAQAIVLAPMFGKGEPAWRLEGVLERPGLPVVLYNNPEIHGGSMLPLPLVREYAHHPRIIGIKDSSGDWAHFLELVKLQSEGFRVFQGRESLILRSLEAGAQGIVAGLANVAPALCKEMLLRRDQATMERILEAKAELKKLSPDPIHALKKKLFELGVIRSDEVFKDISPSSKGG